MDEVSPAVPVPTAPERVGDMLRAGRERAGLSLAEVAARTRVPLRHLQAIENSDFSELPSPTYANGFAKAYARAVNVDEVAVGRKVRGELAGITRRTTAYQPVEATDPARVPSRGLTIVALGAGLALLVLAALYFGSTYFRGPVADPGVPPVVTETPAVQPTVASPPVAGVPTDGQVVVTATDEVWLRLYDADGKTLHQGTLQPGQSFDVPAGARDPQINVGRPDKIRITVNGAMVEGLDLGRDPIKDVRISAAALAARVSPQDAPSPAPSPTVTPSASPTPDRTAARDETPRTERRRDAAPRRTERRRDAPDLSETQRANLEAARTPAATSNSQ